MRRWNTRDGVRAAEAKNNARLAAALAEGRRKRERCWCGAIVLIGPLVRNKTIGLNLYLEPGEARFRVVDEAGVETRMSRSLILRRIAKRVAQLKVPTS